MHEIQKSLDRWIEPPQKRAAGPSSPPAATKGFLTPEEARAIADGHRLWIAGATLSVAAIAWATRLDPAKVGGAPLRKINRDICELLDAIAPLEPLVAKCVKYAASASRCQLAATRFLDAVDDELFECEAKVALGVGG